MNVALGKTEFTEDEHQALIARVRDVIASGVKQVEVGRQSEIPDATLSQYLNGKYPNEKGRNDAAAKLTRWLKSLDQAKELRRQLPSRPDFCQLQAARMITATLSFAREAGRLVLVAGAPGTGKTSTCRQFRADNPRTFYCAMDTTTSGVPAMLAEILNAMGTLDARGTPSHLIREILLRVQTGKCLILIDEAQHLTPKAIEALRAINDRARELGLLAGVAILGNERAYQQVGATGQKQEFAQVSSRIAKRIWIDRPSEADASAIAQAYAAKNGEVLDVKMERFCVEIASKPGGLRNIEMTMEGAIIAARGGGEPLVLGDLQAAYAQLSGQARGR